MRTRRTAVWVLGVATLLVSATCGGGSSGEASSQVPTAPAGSPQPTTEGPPPPAESAQLPAESPPSPTSDSPPPPTVGGGIGSDLADIGPTVSTMAESSAPPQPPEPPDGEWPEGIEGVVAVPVDGADHVRYDVEYLTAPPAGGPHLGAWLNCGFYTVPVLDELAVHSLEHGAVWVTYRSDVPAGALEELAALAGGEPHLLVTPYEAQDSPLVLTAWARQLRLDSLEDSRFGSFLDAYLTDGPTAPEPAAACWGAVGVPPDGPDLVPQQG